MKDVSLWQFQEIFTSIKLKDLLFIFIAIFLMPINWLLESIKWKKLVNSVQEIFNLIDAIQAVLIGVFFGLITPNRVGEFGGRLFKITYGNKINALNLSVIGGFAQFIVTFLLGITSSYLLILKHFDIYIQYLYMIFPVLYVFTIFIYFNFKEIVKYLLGFKQLQNFSKKYIFNFHLSKVFLLKILALSMVRYLVYVSQYVLILYFLGVDLKPIFLFKTISTMLLIQTIVPSFTLIDLGIRGSVLMFLLSEYVENQLIILVCVLLVWILNLVIPAIVGYINFLNLKLEVKNEKLNNHIITNNWK